MQQVVELNFWFSWVILNPLRKGRHLLEKLCEEPRVTDCIQPAKDRSPVTLILPVSYDAGFSNWLTHVK